MEDKYKKYTINLTMADGKTYQLPFALPVGEKGEDGKDGKDGKDGYTPIKGVDYFDGIDGKNGRDGIDGKDGYTPVKGVDYFDGKDAEVVYGTTEGTAFEGNAGAKNTEDIAFLKQALIQSGTITGIEVEQAYTSRITANGENIVDGQKTPVTLIKGKTARCENLVDIDKMLRFDKPTLTKNGNVYTLTRIDKTYRFSNEFVFPTPLPIGYYSYGAEIVGRSDEFRIWLQIVVNYADGTATTRGLSTGAAWSYMNASKPIKSISLYREGSDALSDGDYVSFKNFMFNEGDTLKPYQPYFTDLKHAKIDGIVSTGRNLWNSNDSGIAGITFVGANEIIAGNAYTMWAIPVPKNTSITFSVKELGTANEYVHIAFANDTKIGTPCYKDTKLISYYANWTSRTTNSGDNKYLLLCGRPETLPKDMMINIGDTALPYTPFIQETYQLPETLELPKFDRFNPQTGEITMGTGTATSETGFTEEEIATYDSAIVSLDGKTLEYKLATPTIEKLENTPKTYTAYYQGNEAVVGENEEFGAIPTIRNEYFKLNEV